MQLSDVIDNRRSIRKYKADPVPDEHVIRVLDAARLAPSAANRQPWHFIVVQDKETRDKLAAGQSWAADAPVIIVGLGDAEASPGWCDNDMAIAFEHLVLTATDLGLGTCWMGLTRRNDELKEVLCVPGSLKVIAMTPLGYPDESPGPKDRKPLDQIVSWGQYGKGRD